MPVRYDLYVRERNGTDLWVGSVLADGHAQAVEAARDSVSPRHRDKPILMRATPSNDHWHSRGGGPPPN